MIQGRSLRGLRMLMVRATGAVEAVQVVEEEGAAGPHLRLGLTILITNSKSRAWAS